MIEQILKITGCIYIQELIKKISIICVDFLLIFMIYNLLLPSEQVLDYNDKDLLIFYLYE